jgi:hypothetical protein
MPNTESLNPRFSDIDSWPTIEAVEAMLEGQMSAIASIKSQTQQISEAAEAAAAEVHGADRRQVHVDVSDVQELHDIISGQEINTLQKHYRGLVTTAEADEWFNITPIVVRAYAEENGLASLIKW